MSMLEGVADTLHSLTVPGAPDFPPAPAGDEAEVSGLLVEGGGHPVNINRANTIKLHSAVHDRSTIFVSFLSR